MRKDFYIFRHGETDFNVAGRWQGQKFDCELNENGISQAGELADNLKGKGIEVIFSSPLKRAHKTAEIVSDKLGVPLVVKENLKEGCFGVVEGMTRTEFEAENKDVCDMWFHHSEDNFDARFIDGESKREIYKRFLSVLNECLETDYKVIGIATHGAMMRNVLFGLFATTTPHIANGAPHHIAYEDGKWSLIE